MLASTTYENAIISLRREIINFLHLNPSFLINADSIHGPEIREQITNLISQAPTVKQPFIVFEFREIEDMSFGATQESDSLMTTLVPYGMFLKIYGDFCHITAQKLVALFKNINICDRLYNEGIKILNTSSPTSINEFINDVRWQRCDIQISTICRFNIDISDLEFNSVDIDQLSMPIHIIKI